MIIKEVPAKTILSVSKVYPYVINPYTGCQHACSYCYAHFMKRFSGHKEPWSQFVDVKVNAPDLLRQEITRKKPDRVWISGVCDPYQPLEAKYELTRQCLEILAQNDWPVTVQTRSPLVLRDIDILKKGKDFEVGFSVTTADDGIRKLFEPNAPPIQARVRALNELHQAGIRTFVMIAPILPEAESLAEILMGKVDHVILDRMNYHHADWVYRKYGLEDQMTDDYFTLTEQTFLVIRAIGNYVETLHCNVSTTRFGRIMTLFKNKYRIESARLKGWDYRNPGYYFVTICTKNREHYFGHIANGKMHLSAEGEIATQCWRDIPEHHADVELDEFVVMPNHVHGIVVIREHDVVVETLQRGEMLRRVETLHATSLREPQKSEISPKTGSLSVIIRSYKSAVTKMVGLNRWKEFGWQARFYEHIIQDEKTFDRIRRYIFDNPVKWDLDKENPSNLYM